MNTDTAKAESAASPSASSLRVRNSRADDPRVVLFGQLEDGKFAARRLAEDEVPYTECWPGTVSQVMVYIEPDDGQLARIMAALENGTLEFGRLQDFGGLDGETSDIPA